MLVYFNSVQPLVCKQKSDEASSSIILASQALLVKILITLEPRGAYGSNFEYLCISTLSSTVTSNIFACRALLVKMLITLDRMVYFVRILYTYVF